MIYKIRTKEKGIIECNFDSVEEMFCMTEVDGLTVIEYWEMECESENGNG